MTVSHYAARITEIVDAASGGSYTYPDSFDGDVAACFTNRLTPEDAAEKLMADWSEAE